MTNFGSESLHLQSGTRYSLLKIPIQYHVGAVVQNVSILHASLNWMMIRTHQRTAIHSGWVGHQGDGIYISTHPYLPVSARIRTYPHVSKASWCWPLSADTAHSCSLDGRPRVRDFGRTQPCACALAYTPGSCAPPGWGLLRRIQIPGRHITRNRSSVMWGLSCRMCRFCMLH